MEQVHSELRRAVAERNYPEVQRMLAEGVPPHPKLWFPAIQVGDVDLCALLIRHGLDPNESGADRKPLHYAAEGARSDIAALLIHSGADPNITDSDGMTALDVCCEFAADERAPAMLKLLLDAGTKVSFATAIRLGDIKYVGEVLDADPSLIDVPPPSGVGAPLTMACRCGRLALAKDLLRRGANVAQRNPRDTVTGTGGNTALWYTAQGRRTGRGPVARLLHEHGADPNFQGEQGESPLHVAVAWRHVDVARELLEAGADPNLITDRGETPADFATKWAFKEMEQLVRAYGGRTTFPEVVPI